MTDNDKNKPNGAKNDFFSSDADLDDFFAKIQTNGDAEAKKDLPAAKDTAAAKPNGKSGAKKKKKSWFYELLEKVGIDTEKLEARKEKRKAEKEKKSAKELTKAQRVWRTIGKVALVIACIFVIIGCVLSVAVAVYLVDATADDDELLDLNEIKLSYSTVLLAQNSETGEWEEYERIFGGENRVWVEYADMPQNLINAAIACEDERFLTHKGVDWKRTLAAFINEYVVQIYSTTQGGSTITQQLIKNITDEKAVGGIEGPLRKIREIYRAIMLEKKYTKQQIMEAYLNTFRLSGQLAGVEAAANYFFGKSTSELTAAESAAIVCITQYPTYYDPIGNPENNKDKRENTVLWLMKEQGLLTEADYKAALGESETLVFHEGDVTEGNDVNSYFTDTVIVSVLNDLMEYNNMSREEAYNLFYTGGLKVYLTIDTKIQSAMEDYAYNPENWPDLKYEDDGVTLKEDKFQNQAAMVIMDYDGNLLGIIGGVREKEESLGFNRAYSALRQPGSSFKPIAVYAPAIELNYINYSTAIADEPSSYDDDNAPWPRNYDRVFGYYGSSVTTYKALAVSLNTVAVKVLNMVGPETAYGFCENKFGISTLVDVDDNVFDEKTGKRMIDKTMSLGLGGLTYGTSPYELCAAYVPLGNGGTYTTPHCYTKVVNSRGEVILDTEKTNQTIQAVSEQTAFIMNKLLQGVANIGTAYEVRNSSNGLPVAGKTGTSSDAKDFWLVTLNPYYVMTVWQGYDEPAYMSTSIRETKAATSAIMDEITEGLEYKNFPDCPEGVFSASFCAASGDSPSAECPDVLTGWYKSGYGPQATCIHALAPVQETKTEADFNLE